MNIVLKSIFSFHTFEPIVVAILQKQSLCKVVEKMNDGCDDVLIPVITNLSQVALTFLLLL